MTPADLSRLESLAREATPGPWEHLADRGIISTVSTVNEPKIGLAICYGPNAAYIAAANPAAVLALIELLAQCKATLDALHPNAGLPDSDVARLYNAMMEKLT